jgi:hypothetical protein
MHLKSLTTLTKSIVKISILLLLSINFSCGDQEVIPSNYQILSGKELDQSRLDIIEDTTNILRSTVENGRSNKDLRIILRSRLNPPTVSGELLMATCVSEISGGFVASYNFRGEPFHGSLDYVNSNLMLHSQVIFDELDAHAVSVSDAINRKVYIASASERAEGASLGSITLSGNEFFSEDFQEVSLGSFAATSVCETGNMILATTGNDENDGGGLYLFDLNQNQLAFEPIHDARWVTVKNEEVFVMQGTPGMVHRYQLDLNNQTLIFQNSISVSGADIPESKSTLWVENDWLFVAGGTEGVHLIDLNSNTLINTLTFAAEDAIVNAVAANEDYVFISCGEAGVYVASYDASGTMETLGRLDLELTTSVNHIYQKSDKLYVAAGLEGLIYMQIK